MMFPSGSVKENSQYIHNVPGHVTRMSQMGTPWEHLEFSRVAHLEIVCGVLSGVITVFPASKIQNEPEQCAGSVPEWHIQNVLTNSSMMYQILGHFGDIARTFKMFRVFQFPRHVLAMSPKCYRTCSFTLLFAQLFISLSPTLTSFILYPFLSYVYSHFSYVFL